MKFLILNGPNLNLLGLREPDIYGRQDYAALCSFIESAAEEAGVEAELFQSNHEGALVDRIQQALGVLDALKAVQIPAVEVHLSDVSKRESFRQISYAGLACCRTFMGLGFEGYRRAIFYLRDLLKGDESA